MKNRVILASICVVCAMLLICAGWFLFELYTSPLFSGLRGLSEDWTGVYENSGGKVIELSADEKNDNVIFKYHYGFIPVSKSLYVIDSDILFRPAWNNKSAGKIVIKRISDTELELCISNGDPEIYTKITYDDSEQ